VPRSHGAAWVFSGLKPHLEASKTVLGPQKICVSGPRAKTAPSFLILDQNIAKMHPQNLEIKPFYHPLAPSTPGGLFFTPQGQRDTILNPFSGCFQPRFDPTRHTPKNGPKNTADYWHGPFLPQIGGKNPTSGRFTDFWRLFLLV
jgi:hypothetical protein